MNNKVLIITVAYGSSRLIIKQNELIKRFCKDENFEHIVIDNSKVDNVLNELNSFLETNKGAFKLHRTNFDIGDNSQSHALALNWAYSVYKESCDYCFFIDHDCFPVKDFSVVEMLENKVHGGLIQLRQPKNEEGKEVDFFYFWAGFFMFNNNKIGRSLIDFSPNRQFGLDTGGNLYPLFYIYKKEQYFESSETKHLNPQFEGEEYAMLHNEGFLHFINGSNWSGRENHELRLESLYGILEEKIK